MIVAQSQFVLVMIAAAALAVTSAARAGQSRADSGLTDTENGSAGATSSYEPLRPLNRCLIPQRVRDWAYVADNQILVNAGRRKYRIDLSYGCPALAFGTFIHFDPGPGVGRMCGHINEAVVVRGSRCNVARIVEIDAETWSDATSQPGVSLFRHNQDQPITTHPGDRQRLEMDAGRRR